MILDFLKNYFKEDPIDESLCGLNKEKEFNPEDFTRDIYSEVSENPYVGEQEALFYEGFESCFDEEEISISDADIEKYL